MIYTSKVMMHIVKFINKYGCHLAIFDSVTKQIDVHMSHIVCYLCARCGLNWLVRAIDMRVNTHMHSQTDGLNPM